MASLLNLGLISNRLGQAEEGMQLLGMAYEINYELGSLELCQAQTAVV